MSLMQRLRYAWSSRVESGLYRGPRAARWPSDAVLSLLAKRSYALVRGVQRHALATDPYFDAGAAPAPSGEARAHLFQKFCGE